VCDQANDAICPGRCAPPGAADQCTCRPIDDYKCYKTRQVGDRFARRDVSLEDQFGPTIATIKRPQRLCNPVDADGQGIADPTAHLMCYVLDEPKLSTQNVIVDDRFGEHRLTVKRADSLCLPAEKDEVASALNIDHFKCYSTRRAKGTPRFTPVEIELDDQFEDKTTIVVRPRFLCNPLDKNGEGIEHPESHLLCYRIKDAPGQPRFRRRQVQIIDQFSIQDLKAIRGDCRASSFLCVRATKRLASEGADTP